MDLAAKRQIVQSVSFGGRTAEDEAEQLARYFVETEAWRTVWDDEVDIVFAPKGGGKSAIYSMLVSRDGELFDRGIIVVPAENPRGATAFEALDSDPPESEEEFVKIWRLYFLVLLVEQLESYDVRSPKLVAVREALASIGLTDRGRSLRTIVTKITAAVRRIFSVRSLEGGVGVDPESQVLNGIHAKVIFGEPSAEEEAAGLVSVDQLYEDLDEVMETVELRAWIVLDRLDIAFTSSPWADPVL